MQPGSRSSSGTSGCVEQRGAAVHLPQAVQRKRSLWGSVVAPSVALVPIGPLPPLSASAPARPAPRPSSGRRRSRRRRPSRRRSRRPGPDTARAHAHHRSVAEGAARAPQRRSGGVFVAPEAPPSAGRSQIRPEVSPQNSSAPPASDLKNPPKSQKREIAGALASGRWGARMRPVWVVVESVGASVHRSDRSNPAPLLRLHARCLPAGVPFPLLPSFSPLVLALRFLFILASLPHPLRFLFSSPSLLFLVSSLLFLFRASLTVRCLRARSDFDSTVGQDPDTRVRPTSAALGQLPAGVVQIVPTVRPNSDRVRPDTAQIPGPISTKLWADVGQDWADFAPTCVVVGQQWTGIKKHGLNSAKNGPSSAEQRPNSAKLGPNSTGFGPSPVLCRSRPKSAEVGLTS